MAVTVAEAPKVTVADLVGRLEAGVKGVTTSDGWRQYLALQAKLPRYSLGNTFLVLAQRADATAVGGVPTVARFA